MTSGPDAVLDSIDGALRDYGMSADAMRWTPDPEKAAAGRPDLYRQQLAGEWIDEGTLHRTGEAFTAFCDSVALTITVNVTPFMKALGRAAELAAEAMTELAVEAMTELAHPLLAAQDRRHRIRCARCNPAGNPPPFPGGAEYHRRRKARQRRKH